MNGSVTGTIKSLARDRFANRRKRPARIGHVAITGASRGLGAALAEVFAAPGVRLSLSARHAGRLRAVAEACRRHGAIVATAVVDVTDRAAVTGWLEAADRAAPVDLLIANAGCTGGLDPRTGDDNPETVRTLFAVNVQGVVDTVTALLPQMRARGEGRIAVVSSLAAYCPVPGAAGYAASKAAVKAWAEALRSRVAGDGVVVSVICPGFIDTPMTRRLVSRARPMPIDAPAAARRIRAGVERGRPLIAFPTVFALGVRLLPLLPSRWVDALIRPFDYQVLPEDSPPMDRTADAAAGERGPSPGTPGRQVA